MARPSKKAERIEEIIDAYERCVVRYGIEGTTLQQVADESGLARPLLRHNVGNREDLLKALVARLDEKSSTDLALMRQYLPTTGRSQALVELLFDPQHASSRHEAMLYQALQLAAADHDELKDLLTRWYRSLFDSVAAEISGEYPSANGSEVRAVTTGIVALYFNADAMTSLADDDALFADSKQAALRLLETL